MARSEIDDIFAAKESSTRVVAQSTVSSSTSTDPIGSKQKKRNKKRKRQVEEAQDPDVNEEEPQKKCIVETVHDPSTFPSVSSSKKGPKPGKGTSKTKPNVAKKEKECLDRFKDSRGTGPRRKTEEGFSIFKEAELSINPEAGGTPLCPFDCDCCKLPMYLSCV
ncbi:DUF1764-domain-containing protein [Thelephora ganbajun]|uniref:DUF1764-domain-containing protein n=1 Tax=Thelephora ganbajun TaxID=370292 RepID=A0ACB6ZLR9_THEGA|nr:DUF1764-domain-containing protein [Thelephora ganbajun]